MGQTIEATVLMITLRPQQETFEEAIRDAYRRRFRSVLATAPTGFGKGVVIGDMAFKAVEKGRKVLVVTNRRQIVRQLKGHCERSGIRVGIIMGSDEPDHEAPCQIASIQTLKRRDFFGLDEPGFLLIDECHQEFASYHRLIRERFTSIPVLGFTATPVGPGGAKLSHFDTIVEPIKNSEVIEAGHLLRVHPYLIPSEPDLGGVDLKRVSQDELGQRVEACTIYGDVFKEWEPFREMQTMVILPSRAVCNQFHKMCLSKGLTAKVVDGTTRQEERNDTFSEFIETDCQMLLGVDVVREGLDLPVAQCLIDLQPTHQFRVFWQKVGRVKRPHEGQESAVVIDLAGNYHRHFMHPDMDPPWDEVTTDKTIEDVLERKAGVRCPECGSKDIYSIEGGLYKCEDCKHEWQTKKPWVCPNCRQGLAPWQKVVGGVCPNCGVKVGVKPTRRIRMADGTLRCIPLDEAKKRKKTKANKSQACWDRWRYIAHGWNRKNPDAKKKKTLRWAAAMYKKEMGCWPPPGLKNCPDTSDSGDWKRTPGKVYPWMNRGKS